LEAELVSRGSKAANSSGLIPGGGQSGGHGSWQGGGHGGEQKGKQEGGLHSHGFASILKTKNICIILTDTIYFILTDFLL